MKTIGSLILLVGISMLVLVGIIALSDTLGEAQNSNDSVITAQASGAENAVTPILTVLSYLALVIGAVIAINSFR